MPTDLYKFKETYWSDILAQPAAVADTVASLSTLPSLPVRALKGERIVLTGMGASLHAIHPLRLRLVRAGHTALVVETAELIHAQSAILDARTLIIAVSQFGRSAETVELLDLVDRRASRPFVIGVTNVADSPLALRADAKIVLRAGSENFISCKIYLATLAALEWLGGVLCGDEAGPIIEELAQAAPAVQTYLSDWREHTTHLLHEFIGLRHLFLTGCGVSLAAVGTGAIILKESARFHAEGMSTTAFRHGLFELINPGLYALVFSGDRAKTPLNESLVRDIRRHGGRAVLIGEDVAPGPFRLPALPERLRPMAEMLPVQMLSLSFAVLAGYEPGRFRRPSKPTVVQ